MSEKFNKYAEINERESSKKRVQPGDPVQQPRRPDRATKAEVVGSSEQANMPTRNWWDLRGFPRIILILLALFGVILIAVVVAVVIIWNRMDAGRAQVQRPTAQLSQATTRPVTTDPANLSSTLAPAPLPTSTSTPSLISAHYTTGVAAYNLQDWRKAADAFEQVNKADPKYQDIQQKLSATYYNWGMHLLQPQSAAQALEKFEQALHVDSEHKQAQAQAQRLALYIAANNASRQNDWRTCAIKFEELRDLQADFLDSTRLLYEAYLKYGNALEGQKALADALRIYRKAVALPIPDRSQAEGRIAALVPVVEPPVPVFVGTVFDKPTDAAVRCGSAFASKVWGVVKDKNGRGIGGATVQVSSADGKHSYNRTTNSQGGFEVPGLGCTKWHVHLIRIPGAPKSPQSNTVSVDLNGGRYSGAGIEFRQR